MLKRLMSSLFVLGLLVSVYVTSGCGPDTKIDVQKSNEINTEEPLREARMVPR